MLILTNPDAHQQLHFYQGSWNLEMEYKFLDDLAMYVRRGAFNPFDELPEENEVLQTIGEGVNRCCDVTYGLDFYRSRLRFLQSRFARFCRLIDDKAVKWDVLRNTIRVTPAKWERLVQIDPLIMAYTEHGDPLFPHLRAVFYMG